MPYSIIAAVSDNNIIGKDGKIPWYMPADLQYFRSLTLHNTVVMGRKTYESIGKPLKDRRNLVLSRDESFKANGVEVIDTPESISLSNYIKKKEKVFVIGGYEIYKYFITLNEIINFIDTMYITRIHSDFEGDTFFPNIPYRWEPINFIKLKADDKNPYDYTFETYKYVK